MNNLEKYNTAFIQTFSVEENELLDLHYKGIETWDSVGHMGLITAIEDAFDIMLDTDDIVDFTSYEKGKEILLKEEYGVKFS